jgi:hypothetical protein
MMELAGDGAPTPRAFLHVGAWSIARHQLSLAIAIGCQRIVCIARGLDPELTALHHAAEAVGAQFHVISGARQLSALVTVADEIVVIADGLMVAPQRAVELLSGPHCVVVQPIEEGLAAGFERIDLNHATAGLMLIPGRLVERLTELPADCDVASALTRIALQSAVSQRELPAEARGGGGWKLIRSEIEASELETGWLATQLSAEAVTSPGTWLARSGVRSFGPALLHAGSGSNAVTAAGTVAFLLALVAGWFGFIGTGLILTGIGWLVGQSAGQLARIERAALLRDAPFVSRNVLVELAADAAIVVLTLWSYPAKFAIDWPHVVFPPIVLLGLLRILPRSLALRHVGWLEDRLLLALVLAFAAAAGHLLPVVQILALAALLAGIVLPRIPTILTRS